MNKKDIIVARYNEDLSWLTNVTNANIVVYDKGEKSLNYDSIKLPNIGKEAHTYLHHIIQNYNTLNDINIFLQGEPAPHGGINADIINNISEINNYSDLNCVMTVSRDGEDWLDSDIYWKGGIVSFCEYHNFTIPTNITHLEFTPGAQFAVTKECIHKIPFKIYRNLYDTLIAENDSLSPKAHILERLWKTLFVKINW